MTEARITIVMFTYERTDYALATLQDLVINLRSSMPDTVRFHIADDGSREEHRATLLAHAAGAFPGRVTMTNSERRGYGASYNLAMATVYAASDYLLCIEDDWELTQPLELDELLAAMRDGGIGCMRLGYVCYTQPLRGEFVYINKKHYLALDPTSPEPHVFSAHPRLVDIGWQQQLGPWPEGVDMGEMEFTVAHRPEARTGVAWPAELIPYGAFQHIGKISTKDAGGI